MKIKKIECDQFAGIKEKSIEFGDNINILYGKNESGKSTILELIHALLFQDTSLDKRSDKDFISKNFTHNAVGKDGDVIDGKITIENDGQSYVLTKEWEVKEGSEKLKDNNGTLIKNNEEIEEILNSILKYEQGVYDEIIFSSQKLPQHVLESIFGECKKSYDIKKELHGILMQSVAEIGGADIDAIENVIQVKMKELSSHFDVELMTPEGGANKEWKKEIGKILEVYYKLKNAKNEKEEIVEIETNIETINKEKKDLIDEKNAINEEIKKIDKFATAKIKQDNILGQINYQKEVIRDGKNIMPTWKEFEKQQKDLSEKDIIEISKNDVKNLRNILKECQNIEASFKALNIDAKIENKSNKKIDVINVETGKEINEKNGVYALNGCTKIEIPGIVDIKLFPKDVDFDELNSNYKELNKKKTEIYKKYNITNIDELEELEEKYNEYQNKINSINDSAKIIETYKKKYGSIKDLNDLLENAEKMIDKLNVDIKKLDIPDEFKEIDDFEEYKEEKKERLNEIEEELEEKSEELQNESANLAGRESDSLKEEIENLTEEYNSVIAEYKHYENIYKKFCEIKEQIKADPMLGVEESFNKYLKQISQNNISFVEGSRFDDGLLKSSNNRLTIDTLSEGTKATIETAFKLSVIEHLFPNGQGLAVFDDPFTDMDEDRMNESCGLIDNFSKNNQVIFITCDKKYINKFKNAKVINL